MKTKHDCELCKTIAHKVEMASTVNTLKCDLDLNIFYFNNDEIQTGYSQINRIEYKYCPECGKKIKELT